MIILKICEGKRTHAGMIPQKNRIQDVNTRPYDNGSLPSPNLLWVRKSEHDTLDRLWKSDKEAYFKMIEEIQNENKGE